MEQTYEAVHSRSLQPDVLIHQDQHRSTLAYLGDQVAYETPLIVRLYTDSIFSVLPLDNRVMEAIQVVGFGLLCRAGRMHVDHGLITTLVERWRLETHTFHFHSGEATITLGDVAVL